MEKQKATFKVFSHKTGGVCLDLGEGEAWYELTEKVKDYVEGLQRDTEVLVTVDEDRNVSFIQPAGLQANNGQGLEKSVWFEKPGQQENVSVEQRHESRHCSRR